MRILAAFGALIVVLFVVYLMMPSTSTSYRASPPATVAPRVTPAATVDHASQAGYPYPSSVEATFKRDFANSPGLGDCVLAATEQRYSYDEFVSVTRAYGGTGTLPPSLQGIVLACVNQLQ